MNSSILTPPPSIGKNSSISLGQLESTLLSFKDGYGNAQFPDIKEKKAVEHQILCLAGTCIFNKRSLATDF